MPRKKITTNHSSTTESLLKLQKDPIVEPDEVSILGTKMSSKNKVFFSRLRRKILSHVYLVRAALILVMSVALVFSGLFVWKITRQSQVGYHLSLVKNFVSTSHVSTSAIDGRTNILILGKGGGNHEAPDLTDTIIFVSVKNVPSGKPFGIGDRTDISMISLPRDIWIAPLRAKLNSTYYWGNQKQPKSGGLVLAKSVVEEVVGQPVQHGVVIDFSGFKKIIDVLGGIEVEVQNSFTDSEFPIAGRENDLCDGDPQYKCRYESITFDKGLQYMDGETSLKFVRSRHAEGNEGTDLARAARQELVIKAIKNKILTKEIYLSPKKLIELKDAVLSSIETDISPETAAVLARWFWDGRENMRSNVLSEDLLENPPKLSKYDNLYVFIPKEVDENDPTGRSWAKVQEWVQCVLDNKTCN